jgi:CspA family cold shock protein
MPVGTVKWFDEKKGFGFILTKDGATLFVHHRDIVGTGRKNLWAGDAVAFDVVSDSRGDHAANVATIPNHDPQPKQVKEK